MKPKANTDGGVVISVLFGLIAFLQSSFASASCPLGTQGVIDLTLPSIELQDLCDDLGLGCDVIESFESIQHFFVAFPRDFTLIVPTSVTSEVLSVARTIAITDMDTKWGNLAGQLHGPLFITKAGVQRKIADLKAVNDHLLTGEIRQQFELIIGDIVNIPLEEERLSRFGKIRFRCS